MLTDEELVDRIRAGEHSAFDALYKRYSRRLFGYIRRMVEDRDHAEDIFQDVVMTVLRDDAMELRPGQFAGWLFTVARNRCRTALRDGSRRRERLERASGGAPKSEPPVTPEQAVDRREKLEAIREALGALSEPHQDALILKAVGNLTYRQIADIQNVPEGTAKSRLHDAVKRLRKVLSG